jgi:peptidoglycan/xylan/chitin deacetylase (PgdA/CDA1 family)
VDPFRVALTFDAEHPDRPSARDVQERLLDRIDAMAVASTFFMQGRWAQAYPATARRIAESGHLVGNHSFYHAQMQLLTREGLDYDLANAARAIRDAAGVDARPFFRSPFGAGAEDPDVRAAVFEAGYVNVLWDVEGFDWDPGLDGRTVAQRIVDGVVAHGDDCVVLLHTWPDRTEHAIDEIVTRLTDAGAELVRLDALPRSFTPAA